ncbi:paraben-hydrolyzing esterase precursor [Westerdykella ornata]|uniref:Carboxylic ester hydrolase n=1 Tax=Westerdykella ornata TaxID=318751 RepID=A0A6A6JL99_WESOR|nr:paraben-hydrolyzing esterase precursor [Westerdykella ornata]KAF2276728.1 paraben-hydrolyzing esterase precursor [Westerdykella ornata]
MDRPSKPYVRDLEFRGFIEGLTYVDDKSQPLCHYFGGIPYAIPPVGPFRWCKPRSLPPCYRYGTRVNPGRYTENCSLCPQPGFNEGLNDSLWDEDCLQCNIWVPAGEPPKGGWPVLVWIHGGFLQFGTPRDIDLRAMLSETSCKAIVVTPAYRLNVLGFLASPELSAASSEFAANVGFWDQRLAIEWTWQNISYFGGDTSNIAVGGYSAGAHSAFHQLSYDLGVPDSKSIIRRVLMLSNGPGLQPKSLSEAQEKFEELLTNLNIPLATSASEKLTLLRSLDPKTLLRATFKMKHHQFRAITDSAFVRPSLFHELNSGAFARKMKQRGVKLIIGECSDEHFVYGQWRPPANNLKSLFERLQADYSLPAVEAMVKYYFPDGKLPPGTPNWQNAFGKVYANMQIHALERGMLDALVRHGAGDLVYRYRIEYRARCCDKKWPKQWGVTHGTDMALWFWGNGEELSEEERKIVKEAFHDNLGRFLRGEEMEWGTEPLHVRCLKADGTVRCEKDTGLEEGRRVWDLLKRAGAMGGMEKARL